MIKELYDKHKNLMTKQTEKLACKAGCAMCCNQLIALTKPEWNTIEIYIYNYNLKSKIDEREKETLEDWLKYRTENLDELQRNGIKAYQDWLNMKCIFLNETNNCDIYSVRPMRCRCLTSTVKCENLNQEGCKRFRYQFEKDIQEEIWKKCGYSMSIIDTFLELNNIKHGTNKHIKL